MFYHLPAASVQLAKRFKFCLLFSILIVCFAVTSSCGPKNALIEDPPQDGWAQRYSDRDRGFNLELIEGWDLKRESYRQGVLTIELEKGFNDGLAFLVLTVLPKIIETDDLAFELQRLFETSLHRVNKLDEAFMRKIANNEVVFMDASAGAGDEVLVRGAGYTSRGRTYLFILLSGEDVFAEATTDLEQLIVTSPFH